MLCCSTNCERYETCGRAWSHTILNDTHTVEPLLYWGSASYSIDKDGNVDIKENYVCGPSGNWGMYIPMVEDKKEEDKKMDNLKVSVEITPYVQPPTGSISLDFHHPVMVRSVWNQDELVEIEHDGHKFIVSQSELEKAARACTHNTW